MIVLGLDTALSACSAALVDSATGDCLARRLVSHGRRACRAVARHGSRCRSHRRPRFCRDRSHCSYHWAWDLYGRQDRPCFRARPGFGLGQVGRWSVDSSKHLPLTSRTTQEASHRSGNRCPPQRLCTDIFPDLTPLSRPEGLAARPRRHGASRAAADRRRERPARFLQAGGRPTRCSCRPARRSRMPTVVARLAAGMEAPPDRHQVPCTCARRLPGRRRRYRSRAPRPAPEGRNRRQCSCRGFCGAACGMFRPKAGTGRLRKPHGHARVTSFLASPRRGNPPASCWCVRPTMRAKFSTIGTRPAAAGGESPSPCLITPSRGCGRQRRSQALYRGRGIECRRPRAVCPTGFKVRGSGPPIMP